MNRSLKAFHFFFISDWLPIRKPATFNQIMIFCAKRVTKILSGSSISKFQGQFLTVSNEKKISPFQINIYLFKVNNRNTGKKCEICLKLTVKTSERRHYVVLVSLLLTLNIFRTLSCVSVYFEKVNSCWV